MRTPRLPAVDWTDAPADLNWLVRFAERLNLVSARVPSHFDWPLTQLFFYHGATAPIGPRPTHYRWFMITFKHTTLGRILLDEWSVRRRDLYLIHNTHERQTYVWYACTVYCVEFWVGLGTVLFKQCMLPHNQNRSLTFCVNFKFSNHNKEIKTPWGWSHRRSKHVGVF